jgi:hypothetical protein
MTIPLSDVLLIDGTPAASMELRPDRRRPAALMDHWLHRWTYGRDRWRSGRIDGTLTALLAIISAKPNTASQDCFATCNSMVSREK